MIAIFIVGVVLLLVGVVLLVVPGPGIPVILLGLVVLGAEFAWARSWLRRLRIWARRTGRRARRWRARRRQ